MFSRCLFVCLIGSVPPQQQTPIPFQSSYSAPQDVFFMVIGLDRPLPENYLNGLSKSTKIWRVGAQRASLSGRVADHEWSLSHDAPTLSSLCYETLFACDAVAFPSFTSIRSCLGASNVQMHPGVHTNTVCFLARHVVLLSMACKLYNGNGNISLSTFALYIPLSHPVEWRL